VAEQTEGSIEIEATPAQIMEVITDFGAYPRWAQGVKKAKVLSRDIHGRPTEVAMEAGQMGINAQYTLAYRYRAKDGGVSWTTKKASGAVKDLTGEYLLEPAGHSTRVIYRLTMVPAISLGGFMKRQAERTIINAALGGLKKQVERGS
jgi:ribosome-associated toxin RatA of RatAB toxin-antitoxin module